MPPASDNSTTYDITGLDIFATGTWHGEPYTEADLDAMVESFGNVGFTPPIKLGHSENQKLLKDAGFPAAGWIKKVYRNGGKLLADVTGIPSKIHDLITKKAYDRVSSEIYWDFNDTAKGKKWPRVLKAVALLGADIPEVNTLDAISSLYHDGEGRAFKVITFEADGKPKMVIGHLKGESKTTVQTLICPKSSFTREEAVAWAKEHDFKADKVDETEDSYRLRQRDPGDFQEGSFRTISPGEHKMTKEEEKKMEMEERLKETEKTLEEIKAGHEAFSKDAATKQTNFEKTIADLTSKLEQERAASEKERVARRKEKVAVKVANFVTEAKVSPAQAPMLEALFLAAPATEVTVLFAKDGKTEEKTFTAEDLLTQFVGLQPKYIEGERTKMGVDANDLEARVKAYCKENNLNYAGDGYEKALRAVSKEV